MARFQIFKDARGEFRWRLRAGNNEIIATSGEGYKAKVDCEHVIDLVKRDGPSAPVEVVSESSGKIDDEQRVAGRLEIVVEVGEFAPEEDIADEIVCLINLLNSCHIDCGGNGLIVDDWNIFKSNVLPVEVG